MNAVSLDPIEKGTIESIDETGKGVITTLTGAKIDFQQDYSKELGLTAGMKVKYCLVNIDGKYAATSLKSV